MADIQVIVVHNEFQAIAARMRIAAVETVDDIANQIAADIRHTAPSQRLPSTVRIRRPKALRREVTVGDRRRFHAGFVEYGTIDQAAHPFVVPAAEAHRREFMRRIKLTVRASRG